MPLAGPVDDRWRQDYRLVQLDATDFFRFRLDLETRAVRFEGKAGDGDLALQLDRLENLVAKVNRRASSPAPLRQPA